VLAGWCAGGLVLLAVPIVVPWTVRAGGVVRRALRRLPITSRRRARARRRAGVSTA
jgi:hypothetical protein